MSNKNREKIIIYTDGSSLGNPGPGGWGAIVALPKAGIFELGGKDENTTNNKMELLAVIKALSKVGKTNEDIIIYTDSSYVINGITKWVESWQKNGWMKKDKKEVLNRPLWEKLIEVTAGKNITWEHVSGHSGLSGNERADEIATSFACLHATHGQAENKHGRLFEGKIEEYDVDIFDTSYNEKTKTARSKTRARSRARAYSYLSLVNGVLMRHETWAECETRVKGKSGVKYKKAISSEDEDKIKKEWGK